MKDQQPLDRWYAVRCLFNWGHSREPESVGENVYEERIIVLEADSFDEALQGAEDEAVEYASDYGVEYLGFAQSYYMGADRIADRTEVFSLLRESKLGAEAYISRFFDTGDELQQDPR